MMATVRHGYGCGSGSTTHRARRPLATRMAQNSASSPTAYGEYASSWNTPFTRPTQKPMHNRSVGYGR